MKILRTAFISLVMAGALSIGPFAYWSARADDTRPTFSEDDFQNCLLPIAFSSLQDVQEETYAYFRAEYYSAGPDGTMKLNSNGNIQLYYYSTASEASTLFQTYKEMHGSEYELMKDYECGGVVLYDSSDIESNLITYGKTYECTGDEYYVAKFALLEAEHYASYGEIAVPTSGFTEQQIRDLLAQAKECIRKAIHKREPGVEMYVEDNRSKSARPTVFKHPGDFLEIVAILSNTTDQPQQDLKLTLKTQPDYGIDPDIFYAFKRSSPEEIAIQEPQPISNIAGDGNGAFFIEGLSLPANSTQEIVFRLKIPASAPNNTAITASVTLGRNAPAAAAMLSSTQAGGTPAILVKDGCKIFLTSQRGLYRTFAMQGGQIDATGAARINSLWETMYRIAEEQRGVIYCVDKYDQYEPFNPAENPTITWPDDRTRLPYDGDHTSSSEESAINKAALLIKSMLRQFIDNSGGLGEGGREVVIIGDDAIIPFYRVFDPTNECEIKPGLGCCNDSTVYCNRVHHTISAVVSADAAEGYLFTDLIYRDYDDAGWKNGEVENIFVGRIVGRNPENMAKFLRSSNTAPAQSINVVKAEMWKRDGNLEEYEEQSTQAGYTVIKEVDGVSLDFHPCDACAPDDAACKNTCNQSTSPDPANWDTFKALFNGTAGIDFDVMRIIAHGSSHGVSGSEDTQPAYPPFFNDDQINAEAWWIANYFSKSHPFFIYDSCLVGLTDGQANTLINAWAPLNTRGILAATAVSWSLYGGLYNDSFYEELLEHNAGRAVNRAARSWDITGLEFLPEAARGIDALDRLTRYEFNLYGVPWAAVAPPADRIGNAAARAAGAKAASSRDTVMLAPQKIATRLAIDASGYTIEKTADGYDLVHIQGFDLLQSPGQAPVIPYQRYAIDLPLDAVVDAVQVTFSSQVDLGQLNIPAYVPPDPMPSANPDPGGYIPLPADVGTFPSKQYAYNAVTLDNAVRVMVTILPVVFNAQTLQTTLSQAVDIDVSYASSRQGLVQGLTTNRSSYAPGETIQTATTIENTTAGAASFKVQIDIRDALDIVVAAASSSGSVSGSQAAAVPTSLAAPAQAGSYQILATVSDGAYNIGTQERMIKVASAEIASFSVPETVALNESATLEAGIENLTAGALDALVDVSVYQGQTLVAQLPQLSAAGIAAGETRAVQATWSPAEALAAPGTYAVQMVVTIGSELISSDLRTLKVVTGLCPAEELLANSPAAIASLRAFRDKRLNNNSHARAHVRHYYNYSDEVLQLLKARPELYGKAQNYLLRMAPQIGCLKAGKTVLIEGKVFQQGLKLLEAMIAASSGSLHEALLALRNDLNDRQWLKNLGVEIK